MKTIHRIKARLRSRAGESIAEVLVSLLISSLALVMLAGMISAAARMVKRSEGYIETYVEGVNAVAEKGASPSDGKVTLTAGSQRPFTDDGEAEISVMYYTHGDVVSYK